MNILTVIMDIVARAGTIIKKPLGRFRRQPVAPTGMSQIEVPPNPELLSEEYPQQDADAAPFDTPDTDPDTSPDTSPDTDPDTDPSNEETWTEPPDRSTRKLPIPVQLPPFVTNLGTKKLLIGGAAAAVVIVAAAVLLTMTGGADAPATPVAPAPLMVGLPEPTPTVEEPTSETEPPPMLQDLPTMPDNETRVPPTLRPTVPPPPTLTPTPLPPTPTARPPPTYAPPTATPEQTPTPRNRGITGYPPHVVCITYTLDDRPQQGVTIRLVKQANQNLMVGEAAITNREGNVCLQTEMRNMPDTVVPIVSGWTWEQVDGWIHLPANQNTRQTLNVMRCTGSAGHLPVVRASGELKCPFKQ